MTKLTKPIVRETNARYGHNVLVIKLDDTHIHLREKGKRTWFDLPLATVYYLAAEERVRRERELK